MQTHASWRRSVSVLAVFIACAIGAGSARAETPSSHLHPRWFSLRLAAVVVEGQSGTAATPAAPVAQVAPVAEAPRREIVETNVESSHSYMGTIALSAIAGGVLGVLIGGAIYYLASNQRARNIVYWGAGGVLVGAAVGVTEVMVEEGRRSAALSMEPPQDPSPTFRVALYQGHF